MQYPLYKTLRAGWKYAKQWPVKPELNSLFVENKVIMLTAMAGRFLPAAACVCALIQYSLLGTSYLPQIISMMLFVATLPLQGWYWLGVRAATPLPPAISAWFMQIRTKMQQQGVQLPPLKQPGRYEDLAQVLRQAYQQLDKTFVKQWL